LKTRSLGGTFAASEAQSLVADPEAFWPLVQAMSSEGNFPWLFALKEHLCLRPDFSELETELESAIQIAVRTCAKGT
jgi:hypothetical protein